MQLGRLQVTVAFATWGASFAVTAAATCRVSMIGSEGRLEMVTPEADTPVIWT